MALNRRYPIGIQTFSEIIKGGYVYVDKTDLVWELIQKKYVFLSRPRRFGKSLLSSTFHSYFAGEKELFKGLKIMNLESDWNAYPVLHFDLSEAKGKGCASELRRYLNLMLDGINYGFNPNEKTPGERLKGIIRRAFEQTGKQVVVIIDEYDAPLLEVLHDDLMLEEMRQVMQEFYQPLKPAEPMLKFCFITGITKSSQLSIFSTINNIDNISLLPRFSAICGITETEVKTVFEEDIRVLAEKHDCTPEVMFSKLKERYDGYHFSHSSEDIYNPFSLLKAFSDGDLTNGWFASGTPTFLVRQMKHFRTDITTLEHLEVPSSAFDRSTAELTSALPLLYQSGYLTIKGYDRESMTYLLSIPNQEVKIGITECLIPAYVGLEDYEVQVGFALKFWRALKVNDVETAMRVLQAYLANIPYVEGFKKKLSEAATAEGFYEYTLYLIFSMLNVYVRTQIKCAGGRIDMVVCMPDTTYVFELKTRGTAKQALEQIDNRGYAIPFNVGDKKVVKVGLLFDVESRTLKEWVYTL